MFKKFLSGISIACIATSVLSQDIRVLEDSQEDRSSYEQSFYGSFGQVGFDSEVAKRQGVEDSATFLKLGYEKQKEQALYSLGLNIFFYSDQKNFDVDVVDNFGNRSTLESSANAYSLFLEGGYSYQLNELWSFDALIGGEFIFSSSRSVASCSDCPSDDIDIDSGFYVAPKFKVVTDNNFVFAIGYQLYLSGDTKTAPHLTLGYSF
jgi:hypothetical protein